MAKDDMKNLGFKNASGDEKAETDKGGGGQKGAEGAEGGLR